jgi:hypothetical protein
METIRYETPRLEEKIHVKVTQIDHVNQLMHN